MNRIALDGIRPSVIRKSLGFEQIVTERLMRAREASRAQSRQTKLERLAIGAAPLAPYKSPDISAYQVTGNGQDAPRGHHVAGEKQTLSVPNLIDRVLTLTQALVPHAPDVERGYPIT